MNDIRDIIREREAAELAGAAKRRRSWLALQREGEVGSEWRESVITLMQYPGAIGTILGIIGFAFGLIPLLVTFGTSAAVGPPGLGFVLILLLVPFVTISCVAVGLPLSGAALRSVITNSPTMGANISLRHHSTGVERGKGRGKEDRG